jgi:hypothetical protein
VRSLAFPLALLIVLAAPIVAVGAAVSARQWARWLYRAGGILGVVGFVLTGVFVASLVVPRTCATTSSSPSAVVHEVNRPIISLVLGDGECFRSAMAQAEGAVLAGVASSAVVTLVDRTGRRRPLRRSGRAVAGASPDVRHP